MTYIVPSNENAAALIARGMTTPVVMLNLLRFREVADYAHAAELAPDEPISGEAAYELYRQGMTPLLASAGGEVLFDGSAGRWFIGPEAERWDHVLLVRQASVAAFLAFAQDPAAQAIGRHRTAALEDSRLLPITDWSAG